MPNLRAELTALLGEADALDESKKPAKGAKKPAAKAKKHKVGALGEPDSKNAKRKALIKKLKKQGNVRDPEALATWIGLRKAGATGGAWAHDRPSLSVEERELLAQMIEEDEANPSAERKTIHGQLALIAKTLGYDLATDTGAQAFMAAVKAAVTTQKPQLVRTFDRLTVSRERKSVATIKKGI